MRVVVVGFGIQGTKRMAVAKDEAVAIVDPVHSKADFKNIEEVPLKIYDAALVCTPDEPKLKLLKYLLLNKKHVLCEKPILAISNDKIIELIQISKKNKTTCYTAYNHRFEPHIAALQHILRNQVLGKIYYLKIFYGNGTARDVRSSVWRDTGSGVLPDLGSHLLDMVLFLLGKPNESLKPWIMNCFENRAFDHVILGSSKGLGYNEALSFPKIELEATLLSWRNTFRLDVFAEKGSAHIECLCKWGPSTLTIRKRVLPSGKPTQESTTLECSDPTWEIEYLHFKQLCKTGETNLENDLWINSVLKELQGSVEKIL